jgi:hypothetical protein
VAGILPIAEDSLPEGEESAILGKAFFHRQTYVLLWTTKIF